MAVSLNWLHDLDKMEDENPQIEMQQQLEPLEAPAPGVGHSFAPWKNKKRQTLRL
jgi:hypothetical protein